VQKKQLDVQVQLVNIKGSGSLFACVASAHVRESKMYLPFSLITDFARQQQLPVSSKRALDLIKLDVSGFPVVLEAEIASTFDTSLAQQLRGLFSFPMVLGDIGIE
jgi:hypothetical protein